MAPDLNSVPPSPRPVDRSSRSSSRPTSQLLSPTSPTTGLLPSNQSMMSHSVPTGTGVGGVVDAGPGPLRHPRPLTAADLHMQLEKEQEAVVNRLTRELSILRAAQNASVVSNTSSTSAGFLDSGDYNANHMLSGPSHPQPSTRLHHRSSSSTSTRSATAISTSTAGWTTAGVAGSVSGAVPSSSSRISISRQNSNNPALLSRQNSTTSSRRSGASSPAPLSSSHPHNDYFPSLYQTRPTPRDLPMPHSNSQQGAHLDPHAQATTTVPVTGRYEELAYHRHELEAVKRENEALKRRIKELERTLQARRQSDASRTRSESVSTTASASVATAVGRGREREKEAGEEPVRVGESARNGGLR